MDSEFQLLEASRGGVASGSENGMRGGLTMRAVLGHRLGSSHNRIFGFEA